MPRETRRERRSKTRNERERAAERRTAKRPTPSPRGTPLGVAAAVALIVIFIAPFFVWGNPYPDDLIRYWLAGGAVVILCAVFAARVPVDRFLRPIAAAVMRPSPALFGAAIGVVTLALGLFVSGYVFRHVASTSDEIAQLWHARILLHGRLALPADPNREFFSLDTVIDWPRWYSQFPIGGPLALALGEIVGAPWIVDPVFAGGAAVLLYDFARRTFGDREGRIAALVFASSPMVLMMSGTWMNHVPVLFLALAALDALAHWDAATTRPRAVIAAAVVGLAVGAMATIRPLDAVVAAIAIGVFQVIVARRAPARAWELGIVIVAGLVAVAPLLVANSQTTGAPLRFGYDVAWGPGHDVGFHVDPYGTTHTPAQGLDYAVSYVNELNMYLTAWPVPVVLIMSLTLLALLRTTRWDALLLGFFAAQVLAYAAYWYRGEFLGPRFLFTVVPVVVIMLARLPAALGDRWGPRWRSAGGVALLACVVIAWLIPSSSGVAALARGARQQRLALKIDVPSAVRDARVRHALVFVHERFDARLERRMWGLGVSRPAAAQLLASRDACSLLAAIRAAEADTAPLARTLAKLNGAPLFVPGPESLSGAAGGFRISSPASLTPECRAELDTDMLYSEVPFGAVLVDEPIDAHGRVDGNVVYAADLGERNELLRARFGDRTWYRVKTSVAPGEPPRATLVPY